MEEANQLNGGEKNPPCLRLLERWTAAGCDSLTGVTDGRLDCLNTASIAPS